MAVDGWLYWSHCMCGNEIILTNGFSSQLFCFWLFIQLLWPGIIESSLLDCLSQRHSRCTSRSRCTRPPYRLPFIRDFPQRFPRRPSFKHPSNSLSFPVLPSFLLAPHTMATVQHRPASPLLLQASTLPTVLLSPHSDMPSSRQRHLGVHSSHHSVTVASRASVLVAHQRHSLVA